MAAATATKEKTETAEATETAAKPKRFHLEHLGARGNWLLYGPRVSAEKAITLANKLVADKTYPMCRVVDTETETVLHTVGEEPAPKEKATAGAAKS